MRKIVYVRGRGWWLTCDLLVAHDLSLLVFRLGELGTGLLLCVRRGLVCEV
jgi:hypothetical protein